MQSTIENIVSNNDVVIFMTGEPTKPECGYSYRAVQILNHSGVKFAYKNSLTSPKLRIELKEYSGIKTLPQIFVRGELLGGCDRLKELHQKKKLIEYFEDRGISTTLDPKELVLTDVSSDELKSCAIKTKKAASDMRE